MKDGEYYRWSFTQEEIKKQQDSVQAGTLYWCCSNIGYVRNGRLYDTFWTSENKNWSQEDVEKIMVLTFLSHEDDLEIEQNPQYFEREDIINLGHSNTSQYLIYRRKGTQRSRQAMLKLTQYKIDESEHLAKSANRDVLRYQEKLVEIETTEDISKIYI